MLRQLSAQVSKRWYATGAKRTASAPKTSRRPGLPAVASQPDNALAEEWTSVQDKNSGQLYYWNQKTGETTAIGEPKPGPEGRRVQPAPARPGMGGMLLWGAGVGIAMGVISHIF
ncbi:hypothetical protein ACKKBG_A10220 [Auxenochlorella protothecoides x Auxenochlorella symbiontica]